MTNITPALIASLRELASKATPRLWVNMDDDTFFGQIRAIGEDDDNFELIAEMPELDDRTADFDYIEAAANHLPDLLDEVERLQIEINILMRDGTYKALEDENNKLRAENKRLQKDLQSEEAWAQQYFKLWQEALLMKAELEARTYSVNRDETVDFFCGECGYDAPNHSEKCKFYKP